MKIIRKLLGVVTAAVLSVGILTSMPKSSGVAEAADVSGLSAKQICAQMGAGWNLGNTLESTGANGLISETSWSNPRATQQLIKAVKAKGFTTIRIPVTWGNHLLNNSNTIDPEWFARVHEVVDWAMEEGFFVILNIHHEDTWLIPDKNKYNSVSTKFKAIWKQIANEFRDYDRHLIFEGMNEPRTVGSAAEWGGGTASERAVINDLNQDFVSTVRATGGNNSTRALMIPTYAASNENAAMSALKIPNDSNIIVSIHAYTPYYFTMNGYTTFDQSMSSQLSGVIKSIYNTFVKNGIPVCIGEFGASDYKNTSERVKWVEAFADLAIKYSMPVVIWDNNSYSNSQRPNDNFGLISRDSLKWYYRSDDVVKALIKKFGGTEVSYTPVYGDGSKTAKIGSGWTVRTTLTKTELLSGHSESEIESITVKCNYRMNINGSTHPYEYTVDGSSIPSSLSVEVLGDPDRTATVWWEITFKQTGTLLGDIDDNGVVDVTDLTCFARYLAHWPGYDETTLNLANAEIDGEDGVTAADYSIFARYLAGWNGYAEKYGFVPRPR
ncbi:MAG: cellulase family glycosylhydrolase [Ruminococcus sp.]|nr:cellulase family glycosylhydrolase [Ruminococcus sp.]